MNTNLQQEPNVLSNDDDDYVLAEDFNSEEVSLGDTTIDVVTCSIAQLKYRQITMMAQQDLTDLLRLAQNQPPYSLPGFQVDEPQYSDSRRSSKRH